MHPQEERNECREVYTFNRGVLYGLIGGTACYLTALASGENYSIRDALETAPLAIIPTTLATGLAFSARNTLEKIVRNIFNHKIN